MGWFAFIVLLIITVGIYTNISRQLEQLRNDTKKLQADLNQQRDSFNYYKSQQDFKDKRPFQLASTTTDESSTALASQTTTSSPIAPLPLTDIFTTNASAQIAATDNQSLPALVASAKVVNDISSQTAETTPTLSEPALAKKAIPTPVMEPDEHSLPIVTSLFHSLKNWFFGGNLVVRVGVLVLLVGVVLLLRLLSEYIEISIESTLLAIGIVGLALAGLGLKLAAKRFAYGITLQGAGLAIAYLTTFFAYSVYNVIPSLPSFIALGLLSALTIGLAVRQNTFPLALLALSGGFFAPILTAADTGSLTTLFSYYLLLNVTIAIIAHYRTWKVLNLLGVAVTFSLAYYWGATEDFTTVIMAQRSSLVVLISLHLALYLFVAIRYSQQIIAYNMNTETLAISTANTKPINSLYLYPIDIGLLFSVPVLAFGLFAALLQDIEHALTMTSVILGVIYLGLGWLLIQRSQRYALITEGMLALGFGFLALVIPLAFDDEWIAFGWSIQGLALVWFARRSLRAWLVIFGVSLQLVSIGVLFVSEALFANVPVLTLTVSAISALATMFILRAANSPSILNAIDSDNNSNTDSLAKHANSLGISTQAAQQWLLSINSQSTVFNIVWRSPVFIRFLTSMAIVWVLFVLITDFDQWLASWPLATTTLIALAALVSLTVYWLINRYRSWAEVSHFCHALLSVFCIALVLQLPQKFEFAYKWETANWLLFATLLIGWLVIGQLWLKTWYSTSSLSRYDNASWFASGVLVLAAAVHYGLPDSKGVMTIVIPVALMLAGLWLSYRSSQSQSPIKPRTFYWFNWQQVLVDSAKVFVPVTLLWATISNWTYNGIIWGLPYFPVLNLYDITLGLVLVYALSAYYLDQYSYNREATISGNAPINKAFTSKPMLIILGLISFWVLSSMLIRTLHAFVGTPLWYSGAWSSEQVQTGLTILWTLIALIATIVASRQLQRTLWFMGIGLLAVVVLKLVVVDLSQTEAIWRVVSFLVAGSLILLIGYLAPLPPEQANRTSESEPLS